MQVHYQQSVANAGVAASGVILHDPTPAKQFLMGSVANGLLKLPSSVLTSDYAGKTYFQNLAPHLQNRFYFDPNMGTTGALVLIGQFVDEIAGEDYLHLNVLSNADLAACGPRCTAKPLPVG